VKRDNVGTCLQVSLIDADNDFTPLRSSRGDYRDSVIMQQIDHSMLVA